ncbi:MAG: Gfo/Idh/MocA family oxidoreductase [Sedimentisphaerales bacterium]
MSKKRWAIVGASNRAMYLFLDQPLSKYGQYCDIVAMLDSDRSRMESYNAMRKQNIPIFSPDQFDLMIKKTRPDTIVVACRDGDHHGYIVKALQKNIDVISEKPLTIDDEKCALIAQAASKSTATVRMTFNYRYVPAATRIKELVTGGKIGKVVSVDLNWYLDTHHGSSYFQRWNRLRDVSGGLSIHKACHHFDLVRWWIGQNAKEVFAYGDLNFYGPQGVHNPLHKDQISDGRTCDKCDVRQNCIYYIRWNRSEYRTGMASQIDDHVDATQKYEGYSCRQCIFDKEINIEDTYAAVVKYDGGAFLTYSLNASVPYEGFRLGINGTQGRIEYKELHGGLRIPFTPTTEDKQITYIPMFGGREQIDVINAGGAHGGADPLLLDELLIGTDPMSKVKRVADYRDGIEAVLTGYATHKSVSTHKAVSVDELRAKVYGGCI